MIDLNVGGIRGALSWTPSDSVEIAEQYNVRGLWIGVAGDVAVEFENGNTHTFPSVAAGMLPVVGIKKVLATGTAATGISILW